MEKVKSSALGVKPFDWVIRRAALQGGSLILLTAYSRPIKADAEGELAEDEALSKGNYSFLNR